MAESRNAVAILKNLATEVAAQVALVALMSASGGKGVERVATLVVQTGKAGESNVDALGQIVASVGAGIKGGDGVVAKFKSLNLSPFPIAGQSHKLGADVVCLHQSLRHTGRAVGLGYGERSVNHAERNVGEV